MRNQQHKRAPSINSSIKAPNGFVYFGGAMRTLFRGKGHEWEIVDVGEQPAFTADMDQLTWFRDRIDFAGKQRSAPVWPIVTDHKRERLMSDDKQAGAYTLCASDKHLFVCDLNGSVHAFDGQSRVSL